MRSVADVHYLMAAIVLTVFDKCLTFEYYFFAARPIFSIFDVAGYRYMVIKR